MWHDNETEIDLLGFDRLALTIQSILSEKRILPLTIGLFGDWGSGKSSILRLLELRLKENQNFLGVRFNGWLFQSYDDTKAALISTILQILQSDKGVIEKAKEKLEKLFDRVNWIRILGLAAKGVLTLSLAAKGIPSPTPPTLSDLEGLIKPEDNDKIQKEIQDFRSDFSDILNSSQRDCFVILIDDLDRCLPESVIDILEAIRLFLSVPKTAFIIAADERVVRSAISYRYSKEKFGGIDLSQDYLEKLIQVPLYIPPLDRTEVEVYMYLLFSQLKLDSDKFSLLLKKTRENRFNRTLVIPLNFGIAKTVLGGSDVSCLDKEYSLVARIAPVISSGLRGNPRQIKRFLNTFLLRQKIAEVSKLILEPEILAKLMVLEIFHPDKFKELFEWQSNQDGIPKEMSQLETMTYGMDSVKKTEYKKIEDEKKHPWLKDVELIKWLIMEPSLKNIDLSPYFYLAREQFDTIPKFARRLSQEMQEIIANLLNESDVIRKTTLRKMDILSPENLNVIFENVFERFLSTKNENTLDVLFEFAKKSESISKILIYKISKIPGTDLKPKAAIQIAELARTYPNLKSSVEQKLSEWENSGNTKLAKAAKQMKERLGGN